MQSTFKGSELHEGMNDMRQGPEEGLFQAVCVRQIQRFIFFLWFQNQQLCITYSDIFCICPDFPPSNRFSYSDMHALSFRIYAL